MGSSFLRTSWLSPPAATCLQSPERACWGQGMGARFTWSGSVTSAKEPALALASAFALPAPSSQASPHCLSSSAYTFGSAWDPGTPEAPQEALREEPG